MSISLPDYLATRGRVVIFIGLAFVVPKFLEITIDLQHEVGLTGCVA